ncbi:serine protease [uncultured Murdochiella sp.]|uniref:S1 family peptidase n=1 Tax=uncultured Murdochiella sp. TaxID=1586095 RepID=UPI0028046F33|nr:serine protease [uncultured Murdochiella sp.]
MIKKMSLSEMITYATVLIKCQYSNGTTGSGTGFIINLCQDKENGTCIPVLITNNHVVENSIKTVFEFCKADDSGDPIDTEPFSFTYEGNSWIHHPNKNVDLRCLFLGEAFNHLEKANTRIFYLPLETSLIPNEEQLSQLSAMEDVVMIGYPIGLSDTYNHKPIISRGITSSHPNKNYCGKNEILLDVAWYPGSSGSPVFILNQGAFATPKGISVGERIFLLGVLYGGYEFDARGELQLANLPNAPVPVTKIPTNLGLMIKSQKVLDFEDMIRTYKRGNN